MSPPYGQPFSNPQLNGMAGVDLLSPPYAAEQLVTIEADRAQHADENIQWLLTSMDSAVLLAVGSRTHWLIEPGRNCCGATMSMSWNTLAFFTADGRYLVNRGGDFMLRRAEAFSDWKSDSARWINVSGHGRSNYVWGACEMNDGWTIISQKYGIPVDSDYRNMTIAQIDNASPHRTTWLVEVEGEGSRSPFFADGTLALCVVEGIQLIDTKGELGDLLKFDYLPGMVSVDLDETLCLLARRGETFSFQRRSAEGKVIEDVPLGSGYPAQPPVALGDRRMLIATHDCLFIVQHNAIIWQESLSERQPNSNMRDNIGLYGGQDPLATSTPNGKFIIKHGGQLSIYDRAGVLQERISPPGDAPITSNAAVSAAGNIYFACGLEIYELISGASVASEHEVVSDWEGETTGGTE